MLFLGNFVQPLLPLDQNGSVDFVETENCRASSQRMNRRIQRKELPVTLNRQQQNKSRHRIQRMNLCIDGEVQNIVIYKALAFSLVSLETHLTISRTDFEMVQDICVSSFDGLSLYKLGFIPRNKNQTIAVFTYWLGSPNCSFFSLAPNAPYSLLTVEEPSRSLYFKPS